MLVKSHIKDYHEDHGWLHEDAGVLLNEHIAFLMRGTVPLTPELEASLSPVKHVHWLWLAQNTRVECSVASVHEEKVLGLQACAGLKENEGMYFPYPGGADVCFHQGSVRFPLDIIFLRDDQIVHYVENTRVGSKDTWACKDCDGVIEVNAGFIDKHGVDFGDELAWFANSERNLQEYKEEQIEVAAECMRETLFGAIVNEFG